MSRIKLKKELSKLTKEQLVAHILDLYEAALDYLAKHGYWIISRLELSSA
jgi:hypothetical protein